MNETLKRALSGTAFVAVMWLGTANEYSYPALFGVISIICIYEMWKLRKGKSKLLAFMYVLVPLCLIQIFGITDSDYPEKIFNSGTYDKNRIEEFIEYTKYLMVLDEIPEESLKIFKKCMDII